MVLLVLLVLLALLVRSARMALLVLLVLLVQQAPRALTARCPVQQAPRALTARCPVQQAPRALTARCPVQQGQQARQGQPRTGLTPARAEFSNPAETTSGRRTHTLREPTPLTGGRFEGSSAGRAPESQRFSRISAV